MSTENEFISNDDFGLEPGRDSAPDSIPEIEQPLEDEQRSCAIIGPANSGKTTLLLAMQQACLQEQGDPYKLDFVPESKTAAGLMSLAGEFLFHGQTVRASSHVTNYSFRVFVNDLEKQTPEYFCRLNVTDGPGGYLFPSERGSSNIGSSAWESLVDATREASSLVLCVDGSAPALETLYHGLPQLIFDLKGRQRRLPYRRALLLVTKIDRVVEKFHEHAASYRQSAIPSSASNNPVLDSLWLGPRLALKCCQDCHSPQAMNRSDRQIKGCRSTVGNRRGHRSLRSCQPATQGANATRSGHGTPSAIPQRQTEASRFILSRLHCHRCLSRVDRHRSVHLSR